MPEVLDSPTQTARRTKNPGSKLGAKADVAQAMLSTGSTYAEVHEATGISTATIAELKAANITNPEHVEQIRRGLRNQATMLAHSAMGKITETKLDALSADRIMIVAEKAAKIAGISAPSTHEHFHAVLHRYDANTTTGSGSEPKS